LAGPFDQGGQPRPGEAYGAAERAHATGRAVVSAVEQQAPFCPRTPATGIDFDTRTAWGIADAEDPSESGVDRVGAGRSPAWPGT